MKLQIVLLALAAAAAGEKQVTLTGWFADADCARARAGSYTQTNPDCARRCLENGAAPVFISDQAKAVFAVKDYSAAIGDLGYRLEVRGVVDEAAKTIRVLEVKHLEAQGPACMRRKQMAF